jgi:hypothetical protein
MRVSLKRKSWWERAIDPIAGNLKGKSLTVNGKQVNAKAATKPAARAVGGLMVATAISAVISSKRAQADR